jgi:preprotein translocase subunit SecA
MDGLREGIGLRGYAQRDPKIEYQREGYALFEEMSARVDAHVAETLFKFVLPDPVAPPVRRPAPAPAPVAAAARPAAPSSVLERRPAALQRASGLAAGPAPSQAAGGRGVPAAAGTRGANDPAAGGSRGGHKVGRNDPCPCGSGQKYKKCCGA